MLTLSIYALLLAVAFYTASTIAFQLQDWQLLRSAIAVLANWAFGIAFNYTTGITDGWWFNICIDTGAAAAILWHPAGRWQAVLGVTYCVQIAMHLGYGVVLLLQQTPDPMAYYHWLTVIAFAQLVVLGGWTGGALVSSRNSRVESVDRKGAAGLEETG